MSKDFYPRPPRGGRLDHRIGRMGLLGNFYPRPPRGGRPFFVFRKLLPAFISIHALREEGDKAAIHTNYAIQEFLSTPSARRATSEGVADNPYTTISIHALREEGDQTSPPS